MLRSRRSIRVAVIRAALIGVALLVASGLVAVLETTLAVPNASSAYLLAVIGLAVGFGTVEAVVAAVGSFLAYDFLFVQPVHTFAVVDSGEWLNLLLLLVVSLVVGQLAGRQRRRAQTAELREREARGLFHVSQVLASTDETAGALEAIVRILAAETRMARVWIGLAGPTPLERIAADSGEGSAASIGPRHAALNRSANNGRLTWVAVHARSATRPPAGDASLAAYRVGIDVDGRTLGSLWGVRMRSLGPPEDEESRLLAAAADQIGQTLERDRLRAEATRLEVARRSEALKTALLDSVSHDLRTPLATIRAAAGGLVDRGRRASGPGRARGSTAADAAAVIDRQAAYLDRLVTNLLDMSRIESGALRPDLRPILLDDAVADTLDRLGAAAAVSCDIPTTLPPVLVDEVHLDAILTNVLENALAHVPAGAAIRVSAAAIEPDRVRLTIEDAGPGVPADEVDRLFDKFYRVAGNAAPGGRGSGIGLAVVRGLIEASGGTAAARRSDLGGLAIDLVLATADVPAVRPAALPRGA
jgi:two-component system, OmpR family, sensor histidine kinase KdpD